MPSSRRSKAIVSHNGQGRSHPYSLHVPRMRNKVHSGSPKSAMEGSFSKLRNHSRSQEKAVRGGQITSFGEKTRANGLDGRLGPPEAKALLGSGDIQDRDGNYSIEAIPIPYGGATNALQSGEGYDMCSCGHPYSWHTDEGGDPLRGLDPDKYCGSWNGICAVRKCSCILFRKAEN